MRMGWWLLGLGLVACSRDSAIEGAGIDEHLSAAQQANLRAVPTTFPAGAAGGLAPASMPMDIRLDAAWLRSLEVWSPLVQAFLTEGFGPGTDYQAVVRSAGFDPMGEVRELVLWSDATDPEKAGQPGSKMGLYVAGPVSTARLRKFAEAQTEGVLMKSSREDITSVGDVEYVLLSPVASEDGEAVVQLVGRDLILKDKRRLNLGGGRHVLLSTAEGRAFAAFAWPGGLAVVMGGRESPADALDRLAVRLKAAGERPVPVVPAFLQVAMGTDRMRVEVVGADPLAVSLQAPEKLLELSREQADELVANWVSVAAAPEEMVKELVTSTPLLAPAQGALVALVKASRIRREADGRLKLTTEVSKSDLSALLKVVPWGAL